ncbi:MAG: hypothetical protein IKO42_03015 [Opitutales bacterium]|nr:hypothetical protein [Opitutales bacterium]
MPSIKKAVSWLKNLFSPAEPFADGNTFFVWEPCSKSHAEVVPGYAKYLADLGYRVSVVVHPDRLKEGVFCRCAGDNFILNKISRARAKKYFSKKGLGKARGILVTTVGKLSNGADYSAAFDFFKNKTPEQKVLFVEHEIKPAVDAGTWDENFITLRRLDYKGARSVVVNPHYFGEVKITPKNEGKTKFAVVGALQSKRRDCSIILDAFEKLAESGVSDFELAAIGKGGLNIPQKLKPYVKMKGSLSFRDMYRELEEADFILTSYEPDFAPHLRYITTGTSGTFQLAYGFAKPVVIHKKFAAINCFNEENSVLYGENSEYAEALKRCVEMPTNDYAKMQNALKKCAEDIYAQSLKNLKNLIEKRA